MNKIYFLLFLILIAISSCHKEEKITTDSNAKLEFSRDTIFFDTLFSSTQSITRRLKIYNRNSKAVVINTIELGGKASSQYQTIINGVPTYYQNDFTLRGGDSLYILVSTKIKDKNQSLPFLVNDSLLFHTNGNVQKVQLVAYGMDATFVNGGTIACDTQWTNNKPFVIYGTTRVAPGCTLTINKGVSVYFHDKASLKIEGTLLVKGEKDDKVLFSGDNLADAFKNLPGQWTGITIESTSKNNSINWATVQNAVKGIQLKNDPSDNDTIADLLLNNTIIKNIQLTGLEALGRDVVATNCLFTNSVRSSFAGIGGGNYYLDFCTIANYSYDFFREDSTITFSNTAFSETTILKGPLFARLRNCIVWGDYKGEIQLSNDGSNSFEIKSYNSILKSNNSTLNNNGNLLNKNPLFVSPAKKDFHLQENSPAINAGIPIPTISIDLEGNTRSNPPDIGAYEK